MNQTQPDCRDVATIAATPDGEITAYVSGPYSSDPEPNTHTAMDAGDRLEDAGIVAYVPHLSHFRHQRKPRDYRHWMRVDLAWLRRCDCLLRIPGFSPGADEEVAEARRLGIPVFGCEEHLIEWATAERARRAA